MGYTVESKNGPKKKHVVDDCLVEIQASIIMIINGVNLEEQQRRISRALDVAYEEGKKNARNPEKLEQRSLGKSTEQDPQRSIHRKRG